MVDMKLSILSARYAKALGLRICLSPL